MCHFRFSSDWLFTLWPSCSFFCASLSFSRPWTAKCPGECAQSHQKESRTQSATFPPPLPPHSTSPVRFTVLHSIAYEINRICRCLVLTGSNTIDKDYVCLYTPESVCVFVRSIVCVQRILSAAAWETSTLIGQLGVWVILTTTQGSSSSSAAIHIHIPRAGLIIIEHALATGHSTCICALLFPPSPSCPSLVPLWPKYLH